MNGANWERVLKVDGPQSRLLRVSGLTRFKNEVISILLKSGRSIRKWTILGRRSTFTSTHSLKTRENGFPTLYRFLWKEV